MSVYDEQIVIDLVMDTGVSGFVLKRKEATDLLQAVETTSDNGGIFF